MKAKDIIEIINTGAFVPPNTCDTVKQGDTEREVRTLGVCMMPTVEVLRRAAELSVDMLIVHEPLYYNHFDTHGTDPVTRAKTTLAEELGAVIYRYHDHMHYRPEDLITRGELSALGLAGSVSAEPMKSAVLTLDEPICARAIGEAARERLGISAVRLAGDVDSPLYKIGLCFGTPAGVFEMLSSSDIDAVMVGEACEWQLCEYARDAAALGITKAVIVLGHVGSERDGMKVLARDIEPRLPGIKVHYLECDEVYRNLSN